MTQFLILELEEAIFVEKLCSLKIIDEIAQFFEGMFLEEFC